MPGTDERDAEKGKGMADLRSRRRRDALGDNRGGETGQSEGVMTLDNRPARTLRAVGIHNPRCSMWTLPRPQARKGGPGYHGACKPLEWKNPSPSVEILTTDNLGGQMKDLNKAWKKYRKLYSHGHTLISKGHTLCTKGNALISQGNALISQGYALWTKGNALWEKAIAPLTCEWRAWDHCVLSDCRVFRGQK